MISNLTHQQITVWDTDTRDAYGKAVDPTSIIVRARVQPYTANTIGLDGNTKKPQYAVYFTAPKPISPRVDIEVNGVKLPAFAVSNYHDDLGRYRYTKVVC